MAAPTGSGAARRKARYDAARKLWTIELQDGAQASARFLITALGALSTPTLPNITGVDSFAGESCHTAQWPHRPVDFTGRRVAVVGTGATGVQVIQEVAKHAAQLTVFQRTPNWCAPLHNSPIDTATQKQLHADRVAIFERCNNTFAGFMHDSDRRKALEVTEQEREALYEKLYGEPGFGIWMANFRDVLVDEAANATLSEFVARKIRQRVTDPAIAARLIPRNHGFGTRRVPMETGYYEVYNQPNVRLVDLRETPIECVTPQGIRTSAEDFAFDMIIYATGFDAVTGGFARIDIRGEGGVTLTQAWSAGPRTYLGLFAESFPNLLTLVGPHNAATFCNMPRCIEQNVEWVTALVRHMRAHNLATVAPTHGAVEEWTAHVYEGASRMLLSKVDSWFMGINTNVPGKQQPTFLMYAGGLPYYRKRCDEIAANGYEGLLFG